MIIYRKERFNAPATAHPKPVRAVALPLAAPMPVEPVRETAAEERREGAWRVQPFEGRFELSYADASGRPSLRRLLASELKIGPGKLLLGGVDADLGSYRGFRVDRIRFLKNVETGEAVGRNIVDWLLAEADRLERERRREQTAARKAAAKRPKAMAA